MIKLCVLICVVGATVGDKPPTGVQPHHLIGQGGFDSFGQSHAAQPAYDSQGKGYAAPAPPAAGYGPPQGDIPVVYYPIRRPKPEKEEKGYFKAFESKMKEYSDKFTKMVKDYTGYGEDYDYVYPAPATGYGPPVPVDSYGPPPAPPVETYGPPPTVITDSYGPPPVEYEYVYEEEKDKGFGDKMKGYYDKFVSDVSKWQEKAAKKMKEMFGYDYDYVVDYEVPATGYGVPDTGYGPPAPVAPPAPAYGAPAPTYTAETPVVYQPISRPKEPKAEKGGFFSKGKTPKRRPIKKPAPVFPAPQAPYHAPPPQPTYHAPQPAPVYNAPQPAPVYNAPQPTYNAPVKAAPAPAEYGPPKTHDITHVNNAHVKAAPVKAKGGHVHHAAPAPAPAASAGVSSYTSH